MYIDKKLTVKEIVEKITEYFDDSMFCMGSDENSSKPIIRLYPLKSLESKGLKRFAMSFEDDRDDRYLRCIESSFLSDLNLKGIKSISKVFMTKPTSDESKMRKRVKETGEIEKISEWVLETEGTALLKILCQKYVDHKRTYSDDIWEMYGVSV
jgi:DNA-directed RNA polymerase II subunit RPB1